jgi:predicted enzyme related to lactoylglutathione lyase
MPEKVQAADTREPNFPHGQLCYLQIPALDVMESATSYEQVFGWRIERPYPSFEAPGLIGQWFTDRPPAPEGGLLAWISVHDIDETVEAVRANGGEIVAHPASDGPRWLATIRDPAGNVIGIAQHGPRAASS